MKKNNLDKILFYLGALVTLAVVVLNFLALENNLICSDEGWYLTLMRDMPKAWYTRFYLLFGTVFANNIYINRVFCWLLLVVGAFVLSYGIGEYIYPYMQPYKKWHIICAVFFAIYCGQMSLYACPSLNYITLNKVAAELGIGLLALGIHRNNNWILLLSGLFIAYLFPIMITNVVLILLMILFICAISQSKIINLIYFCVGVLLFVSYYLLCVETPSEVFAFIVNESQNAVERGNSAYGLMFFVQWGGDALLYFGRCLVTAILLYVMYIEGKKACSGWNIKIRNAVLITLGCIVLLYAWNYIYPVHSFRKYSSFAWFKDLYWILLFLFTLLDIKERTIAKDLLALGILLTFTPVCLSFGSDIEFYIRGASYLMFITPVVFVLQGSKSNMRKYIVLIMIVVQLILFSHACLRNNWHGERYFGDKVELKSIGVEQHLKLDAQYIARLDTCRKYVPQGDVLCSVENWMEVCLLGYKPVDYEFNVARLDSATFQMIVKDAVRKNGGLWIISNTYEWNNEMTNAVNRLGDMQVDSIVAGGGKYYYISNNLNCE